MNVLEIPYLIPAAAAVAGLALGVLFGRSGARDKRRAEELEVRVSEREAQIAQLEAARSELAAQLRKSEAEREEVSEQLTQYRAEVTGHFTQTSELLRDMTLQYRNIYQHLAQGAETLCPEGTLSLDTNAPVEGLAEPNTGKAGPADADDDGGSVEAAHEEAPLQVDPRPDA